MTACIMLHLQCQSTVSADVPHTILRLLEYGRSTAAKNVANTLEARARDATAAAEAAANSSAEAEAKVEEVRKALKAEAGGAGGSLAGGGQVRDALIWVRCMFTQFVTTREARLWRVAWCDAFAWRAELCFCECPDATSLTAGVSKGHKPERMKLPLE